MIWSFEEKYNFKLIWDFQGSQGYYKSLKTCHQTAWEGFEFDFRK